MSSEETLRAEVDTLRTALSVLEAERAEYLRTAEELREKLAASERHSTHLSHANRMQAEVHDDLIRQRDAALYERDEARRSMQTALSRTHDAEYAHGKLAAELVEERRHMLAEEERRKLTGDALHAEAEAQRLAAENAKMREALRRISAHEEGWDDGSIATAAWLASLPAAPKGEDQ